jgi:4'-phosphopantetheinyl transferase
MTQADFLVPPAQLLLSSSEIHVWRVPLTALPDVIERLRVWLSSSELARAARFYHERDRSHFIVGRAALRSILARYLDINPADVTFDYGPQGKPALAGGHPSGRSPGIEFNLAHSHGLALCAIATRKRIGIDLEHIRPMPDATQIAARFFSASEQTALEQIPEESRGDAFFRCWTRKEAFIKAVGQGLSMPLDSFDVSLDPDDARLLRLDGDPDAVERWRLAPLSPSPGFVAAVAVEGAFDTIRLWQFTAH